MADIFVSYTSSDRDWAHWIALELETLGHVARVHEWEIGGGDDIYSWMEKRHEAADRVLCVVSDEYFKAPYSTLERNAALWQAAAKRPGFVLLVAVKPCKFPTLTDHIRSCELFGVPEDAARLRFRQFMEAPAKPDVVAFPGTLSNISVNFPHHFQGPNPELMAVDADIFDVFLSHAHVDGVLVEKIGVRLADQANLRIWLDRWVLVPGEHWQQQMAKGIGQARSCAVFIGTQTPRGWFQEEIERSLNRQTRDPTFRVIPVILPGGDRSLVDAFLELRTWVDFSEDIDDGRSFHLLLSGVKGVPPGRYVPAPAGDRSTPQLIRQGLLQIKELRRDELIDENMALEYRRKLLDQLIRPGDPGSV